MENIIYNELIRCGFTVDVGVVEYNYKNSEGKSKRQILKSMVFSTMSHLILGGKSCYNSNYENQKISFFRSGGGAGGRRGDCRTFSIRPRRDDFWVVREEWYDQQKGGLVCADCRWHQLGTRRHVDLYAV